MKQLKPSDVEQDCDDVDLGHVKLNLSNLKSARGKEQVSNYKRKFPLIQIRSKRRPGVPLKLSQESNLPKFLIQQK